jgi:hypothetical protein
LNVAFEQKDGQGAIFKNDNGDNPARPDYKGNCQIDGKTLSISAWVKEGTKGKFLSMKFEPPREEGASTVNRSKPAAKPADDFDDSVPF